MRTKELAIICMTIIVVVLIICGTLIYLNQSTHKINNSNQNTTNNNQTNNTTTTNSTNTQQSTTSSVDTDEDGYIDGNKITYRNKNYLGADSGLEEFSTNEQKYIKQKSTGRIAKRHLDGDGAYRYYDMQTGECVLG